MDAAVRQALIDLCRSQGAEVLDSPERLEALLRDVVPGRSAEIHCLVSAVRNGAVRELRDDASGLPREARVQRVGARLHEQLGLDQANALWAAESLDAAVHDQGDTARPDAVAVGQPVAPPAPSAPEAPPAPGATMPHAAIESADEGAGVAPAARGASGPGAKTDDPAGTPPMTAPYVVPPRPSSPSGGSGSKANSRPAVALVIVIVAVLVAAAAAFVLVRRGGEESSSTPQPRASVQRSVPAGSVAAVGGGVVTQEQFDQIWRQAEAQYKSQAGAPEFPEAGSSQYNELKASIVNYLVQNEVIKAKAAELGVDVTDAELQTRMNEIVQQVGGQKKLDKLLKEQAVTQAQLEAQLRAQMLQDAVQEKVYASAQVTSEQIEEYYTAHADEFAGKESVEARHILVGTKAQAEKVRTLLEADPSDANWKRVAKLYSTDPGSKNSGGSLGSFAKGRMVKPFEDAAFSLDVGEISQPVKTQFGYHIIEVTEETPAEAQSLEEATPAIKQRLAQRGKSAVWKDWLKAAMKDAGILYAVGFNPDMLTASPSPSASTLAD